MMRCFMSLLLATLPAAAMAFDFDLTKETYLPGEPLNIRCLWPAGPAKGGSIVNFVPFADLSANDTPERAVPSGHFIYNSRFGVSDCIDLRAPFAPGTYRLEAIVSASQPFSTSKRLNVADLPAQDVLTFRGSSYVEDAEWHLDNGNWFTYDITLTDDRCVPEENARLARRNVWIALIDRDTQKIERAHNGRFTESSCGDQCGDDFAPFFCHRPGTYAGRIRAPERPGNWDLVFVQSDDDSLSCGSLCKDRTINPERTTILDRIRMEDPVEVERIYFSTDREGMDVVEKDLISTKQLFVWVLFARNNPYQRETLQVQSEQATLAITQIELVQIEPTLYRSEESFQPFDLFLKASERPKE